MSEFIGNIKKGVNDFFYLKWNSHSAKIDYSWVPTTIHTPIPLNAILAGYDSDGSRIFVGRVYFQGDLLPCKIIPTKSAVYVSNNGVEHYVGMGNYFEV